MPERFLPEKSLVLFASDYMDAGGEMVDKQSSGPQVFILKCLLSGTRFEDPDIPIVPDVFFDESLERAIKRLQKEAKIDQDGCFGPMTRTAFIRLTNIDIFNVTTTLLASPRRFRQPDGQVVQYV